MSKCSIVRASVCALLILGARAEAQTQQAAASPIDDLLIRAQQAFNDLNYLRADSIARQVLAAGRTTQEQRTRAMLVIAAAYYPEEVPAQKRSDAIATLKQVVRTNLDVTFPQELTWPGLDSLLAEARRSTFGVTSSADSMQVAVGPTGAGEIRMRTSRPATYLVTVAPADGGAAIVTDSLVNVSSGAVRFATMRNDRPIFTSGDYEIVIVATDRESGDTATIRRLARITAPELSFSPIPVAMDSSRLMAERTSRYGWKGVIVGGLVGGGIFGLSSAMSADPAIKETVGPDSKGAGVAALAGIAVLTASFMDKGRQIPSAITANQQLRDDFGTAIRTAQAENANRIATYRTTIAIQPGAR